MGVEVFKGLNQLKRAPGHYFARIRYITLAGRQALQDKLGLLMKSSGWANRYPDSAQIIRHTTLGELTWTITQVVDQPTVVDIRAKLSKTAFGDVKALNLVKRPPAWWSRLETSRIVAYEYSRFHNQKQGAAFTDIERMTHAILPGSKDDYRRQFKAYAHSAGYKKAKDSSPVMIGPNKETLVIDSGPGALLLVHHQNRWLSPHGPGPFRE